MKVVGVAEVLAAVHAVRVPANLGLPRYAPYRVGEPIVSPWFTTRRGLWERAARVLEAPPPAYRETFIHRDYHPGNVLWDGAKVTGVVDWTTACLGPPGIDLARMRLHLAQCSREAADQFVAAYRDAGGDRSARRPYWDLLDAADFLLDLGAPTWPDGDIERLENHVESLLGEL